MRTAAMESSIEGIWLRQQACVCKRLPQDWEERYASRPFLLETFVEKGRFTGASYRVAKWTVIGQTQGRGKLDLKDRFTESLR